PSPLPPLCFTAAPPPDASPFPLHAALPIVVEVVRHGEGAEASGIMAAGVRRQRRRVHPAAQEDADRHVAQQMPVHGPIEARDVRSEEHTSELQSLTNLVCRLLLVKKKKERT